MKQAEEEEQTNIDGLPLSVFCELFQLVLPPKMNENFIQGEFMKEEYDLSRASRRDANTERYRLPFEHVV